MAWIESHQSLRDHPKTRKLARILGISVPTAIGHLHCLWWWAMDYSDDGDVSQYDEMDIAIGGGWDDDPVTFFRALTSVGFLDQDYDQITVHDWDDYGGKLTRRRKENAERMREARAKSESRTKTPRAAHVQRTQRERVELHNSTQENTTQENQQVEGANAPNPPPAPLKKRATRIPADFAISDRDREWAREKGASPLQIEQETEKFVNYWTAESGAKASKIDWHAAWKVWVARDFQNDRKPGAFTVYKGGNQSPPTYSRDRRKSKSADDLMEEALELERLGL